MRDRKRHPLMSPRAFAEYGCNAVGYVRQMRSEEAELLYPQAPTLGPGADGLRAARRRRHAALHHRQLRGSDPRRAGQQLEPVRVH